MNSREILKANETEYNATTIYRTLNPRCKADRIYVPRIKWGNGVIAREESIQSKANSVELLLKAGIVKIERSIASDELERYLEKNMDREICDRA